MSLSTSMPNTLVSVAPRTIWSALSRRSPRPAPGNSNCLKLEPRHNLHLARMESVRQSADLAEVAAAPPESCSVKSCAIEGVERLHPDLEPHVLPNVELLSQSQ